MSLYSYCVKHHKEYLLCEWDSERNVLLTPENAASTSTVGVRWKCENGHSWQTQISSRAKGNSGSPICLREKIGAQMEKSARLKRRKSEVAI